jgi:hypothetical protein
MKINEYCKLPEDIHMVDKKGAYQIENLVETRDFYFSTKFFERKFSEIISPLINSFDANDGVSLHLEDPSEHYTSTTTMTLISLHHMNLLDSTLRKQFHDVIFKLRDQTTNPVVKKKSIEDAFAWDVSESACIWATAFAIWALLETGYAPTTDKKDDIKNAILWLVKQQNTLDGGWGFDISCKSRIFFTTVTLHALKLSLSLSIFEPDELANIKRSIGFGIKFITGSCKEEKEIAYWNSVIGGNDKDPASTLYALWALHETDSEKYSYLISKGLRFIRNDLHGKEIWEFKEIVVETNTKYGTQKTIISYPPFFPIIFLKLGVSPFDELCIKPVTWLKNNRVGKGWNLPGYSDRPLTFTTALALRTINQWHRSVMKSVLEQTKTDLLTLSKLQKRISILLISLIGVIIVMIFVTTPIVGSFMNFFNNELVEKYGQQISIIASIMAILGVSGIISALRYLDKHIFNGKLSTPIKKLKKFLLSMIYLK